MVEFLYEFGSQFLGLNIDHRIYERNFSIKFLPSASTCIDSPKPANNNSPMVTANIIFIRLKFLLVRQLPNKRNFSERFLLI